MNSILFKLTSAFLLVSVLSYGQSYSVLKTDIIGPIRGHFNVTYEHSVGKIFAAQLTTEWGNYGEAYDLGGAHYKATGYGIIPEVRLYPFRAANSWKIQPFVGVDYRYLRFYEAYETSSTFAYMNSGSLQNIGLVGGGRFKYKRLWVELLMGGGIASSATSDYSQNAFFVPRDLSYEAFLQYEEKYLRVELSIGYFFEKHVDSPADYYRNSK